VKSGQEQGRQPLFDTKVAYADWMQALVADFQNKKADIALALIKILESNDGHKRLRPEREAFKNRIGHWFNDRHSTPLRDEDGNSPESDALVQLMRVRNIGAPESSQGRPFNEVLIALQSQRDERRKSGGNALAELDVRALFEDRLISYPSTTAKELDFALVGLGSAYFDNQAPTYSLRDVDIEILGILNNPKSRFVVISGPPKSGKTRTLLENLKNSTLANAKILWLEPSPGIIDLFIDRTQNSEMNNSVIVLDDIQRFGFDAAGGITLSRLKKLASRCKVLITVHADSLFSLKKLESETFFSLDLESQPVDRSSTKSSGQRAGSFETRETIANSTVTLERNLSAIELSKLASEVREILEVSEGDDDCQLASIYASIDKLESNALSLYKVGDAASALLRAVIATYPVSRNGIQDEVLLKVAHGIFAKIQPNARIRSEKFDSAFDELTQGIVPGSDKAILVKQSANENRYMLLDGLWDRLRPLVIRQDFQIVERFLTQDQRLEFGTNLWWQFDFDEEASRVLEGLKSEKYLEAFMNHADFYSKSNPELEKSILTEAAQFNYAPAQNRLGVISQEAGDLELAADWYNKAADQELDYALFNLGNLEWNAGNRDSAKGWFLKAAEQGLANAQDMLGDYSVELGDLDSAKEWYIKAAEQGFQHSQDSLGDLAYDAGDIEAAKDWYNKAAEQDFAPAQHSLGLIAADGGDLELAKEWYTKAAEQGHAYSQNRLGVMAANAGDLELAKEWYTKALESDLHWAQLNMGHLARDDGDLASAVSWYTKAAEQELDWAKLQLGRQAADAGDLELAKEWYIKAAEQGLAQAQDELGDLTREAGDLGAAKEWYTKAAEQGLDYSQDRLGDFARNEGDIETAKYWYAKAAEQGLRYSLYSLGELAYEAGNIGAAKEWYIKAAEQGHAYSQASLGDLAYEDGDLDAAKEWYIKAAEQGHAYSQASLGDLAHEDGDLDAAKEWYIKAAEQGEAIAQDMLGDYSREVGNLDAAKEWYIKAAEQGLHYSQVSLGDLAEKEGDTVTAKSWYERAASGGNADAQTKLAKLLLAQKDSKSALELLEVASKGGSFHAQFILGSYKYDYEDKQTGLNLIEKAAENSDESAVRWLQDNKKSDVKNSRKKARQND
jgi:TPR repeat protein